MKTLDYRYPVARNLRLLFSTALIVLAVGVWAALWHADPNTLARIRREGVIRIGYSVESPYAWPAADGRVTGEAAEVARAVVARMGGPRIEWRMADFGALLDGLRADAFDVVAASMFITPERQAIVAFSEPSLCVGQGLVVRQGNPLGLHAYEDVASHTSAVVAVMDGTVEETMFRRLGVSEERILRVPDVDAGVAALQEGRANGLALTDVAVARTAADSEGVEAADPFRPPGASAGPGLSDCGFAFRPTDRELRETWNRCQREVIGSAEHLRILEQFGLSRLHIPRAARTGEDDR